MRARLIVRIARLILFLNGRRHMPDVQTLAAQLGVTPRTLYRDLAALEEAGMVLPRRWQE